MPMSSLKSLHKLATAGGGELELLIRHAACMQCLSQALHAHLGPPFDAHCQVANVRDGMLVVQADSSAWAAKLRFQVAAILAHLNQQPLLEEQGLGPLQAMRVKVAAPRRSELTQPVVRPSLSKNTAALLTSAASAIGDPELRAVLLSLAARHS